MIPKLISDENIAKAKRIIAHSERFVIVPHVGPDGDAMGASLGLWHYLTAIEKEAVVIVPTDFPDFLKWMPGCRRVIIYEHQKETAVQLIATADVIFTLDFNAIARCGDMAETVLQALSIKIMIDHHLYPDNFANIIISHPEISSTSELIFRFIIRMGDFPKIDRSCAECIYVGMMTDTGNFSYNSNNPGIYLIVAELLKIGINKDAIYNNVYGAYSVSRFRLMGYTLHKKMKIYPKYRTALLTLSAKEMTNFDFTTGDTEGFVNMPLSIKGIEFSVFMREDENKIKISFRSQGTFPANKVAKDVFDGGGHLNAAGAESYTTIQTTVKRFLAALPNYSNYLNRSSDETHM
ncbi:MAG: DHH family phosphoesterase [Prevotellaceae bacterium]|jgi:phosphoesterase RecJ-like protein|nr:DHH family phosphoesterase [Prevotellaceae bacterium]